MNQNTIRDAIESGYKFSTYNTESQIEDIVRWKINDALKLRGQGEMDANVAQTTVKKITEVIMRDYLGMTDKELGLVLEMGVSGEFGRDTWVSGGMILQWLRQYQMNPHRISILDEANEQEKESKRKTKAEIDELNRQAFEEKIHSAFDYFKECRTIWSVSEDERARRMDKDDPRCFHCPQWAAIVYNHYREEGKIKAPTQERLKESQEWGANKVAEHATKKEYLKGAREDWADAYLLEKYFEDIVNGKL